jgi:hypothetical protein
MAAMCPWACQAIKGHAALGRLGSDPGFARHTQDAQRLTDQRLGLRQDPAAPFIVQSSRISQGEIRFAA